MDAGKGRRQKLTPEEREQRYKQRLEDQRVLRSIKKTLAGWWELRKYESSSSNAVHTVTTNGTEYQCTCQAFRIRKQGSCKHTEWAKIDGAG
jgi:hypothetical protein